MPQSIDASTATASAPTSEAGKTIKSAPRKPRRPPRQPSHQQNGSTSRVAAAVTELSDPALAPISPEPVAEGITLVLPTKPARVMKSKGRADPTKRPDTHAAAEAGQALPRGHSGSTPHAARDLARADGTDGGVVRGGVSVHRPRGVRTKERPAPIAMARDIESALELEPSPRIDVITIQSHADHSVLESDLLRAIPGLPSRINHMSLYERWITHSLETFSVVEALAVDPQLALFSSMMTRLEDQGVLEVRDLTSTTLMNASGTPVSCLKAQLHRGTKISEMLRANRPNEAPKP